MQISTLRLLHVLRLKAATWECRNALRPCNLQIATFTLLYRQYTTHSFGEDGWQRLMQFWPFETKIKTPSQSDILSILIELRYNVESTISYWNMELVKDRRVVIPNTKQK